MDGGNHLYISSERHHGGGIWTYCRKKERKEKNTVGMRSIFVLVCLFTFLVLPSRLLDHNNPAVGKLWPLFLPVSPMFTSILHPSRQSPENNAGQKKVDFTSKGHLLRMQQEGHLLRMQQERRQTSFPVPVYTYLISSYSRASN